MLSALRAQDLQPKLTKSEPKSYVLCSVHTLALLARVG